MNRLTKNGIPEIFRTDIAGNKVLIEVDITFQIISIKPSNTNSESKSILTCGLSDSKYKYGGFVFVKDINKNLKIFDIVKLKQITHQLMSDRVSHAFLVKDYEIINNSQNELIGTIQGN